MKHDYNRAREERFGALPTPGIADLRAEIDRLDDEVARLKDSRQAIWDTLVLRAAKLSRLSVVVDRIGCLHVAAYDDGDPDRPAWCEECGHQWPCRTVKTIMREQG